MAVKLWRWEMVNMVLTDMFHKILTFLLCYDFGQWRSRSSSIGVGLRTDSFTSEGYAPQYPLDKRLSEPQDRCLCCWEETNLFWSAGIEPRPYSQWSVGIINYLHSNKTTNSVALSPQANSTDWATATCRRNLVPTSVDREVSRDQRGGSLTVVNLFSRPEPLLFFQVAPHWLSQGLSGPRSRPNATQKIW
jgi:hypothetical protein